MYINTLNGKFYDFWRDGVTQSMMQMFLSCPIQCSLYYGHGYTPVNRLNSPMLFGNICHSILEKAYSSVQPPLPGIIEAYLREYVQSETQERLYTNLVSSERKEYDIEVVKASAIMRAYFINYFDDFKNNWEFAEKIFKVPYTFSDGKRTYITGKIDGGFIRTVADTSNLIVMDHKCMGRINWGQIIKLQPVDIQLKTYLWAMFKMGNKPVKFIYNIIRNPSKKPLERKDESLDTFRERLFNEVLNTPDEYFFRNEIPICYEEIEKWEREFLQYVLRDMRRWYETKYKWPEYYKPTALKNEYGSLSPMTDLILTGDMTGYYQRKNVFEELVI